MKTIILILTFFAVTLIAYSQTDRTKLGIEEAKNELKNALNKSR